MRYAVISILVSVIAEPLLLLVEKDDRVPMQLGRIKAVIYEKLDSRTYWKSNLHAQVSDVGIQTLDLAHEK